MDPKILNDLKTLQAHAAETQRLASDMIRKLEGENPKRKNGLSDERKAQLKAHRMKHMLNS